MVQVNSAGRSADMKRDISIYRWGLIIISVFFFLQMPFMKMKVKAATLQPFRMEIGDNDILDYCKSALLFSRRNDSYSAAFSVHRNQLCRRYTACRIKKQRLQTACTGGLYFCTYGRSGHAGSL